MKSGTDGRKSLLLVVQLYHSRTCENITGKFLSQGLLLLLLLMLVQLCGNTFTAMYIESGEDFFLFHVYFQWQRRNGIFWLLCKRRKNSSRLYARIHRISLKIRYTQRITWLSNHVLLVYSQAANPPHCNTYNMCMNKLVSCYTVLQANQLQNR